MPVIANLSSAHSNLLLWLFQSIEAHRECVNLTDISIAARMPVQLELPYRLCDVFTATPLQGNQLAVFEDAGDLTTAEMQKLANETNLSETTFIIRRDSAIERAKGVRVRIFTTHEELPFAGHPTLGTACTIRSFFPEYAGAEQIVLDLNIGKIPVQFSSDQAEGQCAIRSDDPGKAHLRRPSRAGESGCGAGLVRRRSVARRGATDGLYGPRLLHRPSAFAGGAWRASRYPSAKLPPILRQWGRGSFIALRRCPANRDTWQARMQFYNGEDPGDRLGGRVRNLIPGRAFARRLRAADASSPGSRNRPRQRSVCQRQKTEPGIDQVRVGGSTVPVAKGVVFLERFT